MVKKNILTNGVRSRKNKKIAVRRETPVVLPNDEGNKKPLEKETD